MSAITSDEILELFEKSSEAIRQAVVAGDFRANNREYSTIIKIFKRLEKSPKLAQACTPQMLHSKNIVARTQAAAYCLALGINVEDAVNTLKNIAQDKESGEFSFNAEMTLKVWKQDGVLKIY